MFTPAPELVVQDGFRIYDGSQVDAGRLAAELLCVLSITAAGCSAFASRRRTPAIEAR